MDEALDAALGFLDHEQAGGAVVAEVAALAGLDGRAWPTEAPVLDRLTVPANDGTIRPLRPLHAALASGYDPSRYAHPDGRITNLVAQLSAHVHTTLRHEANDAVFSFQLLALHAAGRAADDVLVEKARESLLRAQRDDGAWGCAANWGVECTAFALAALVASGGIPDAAGDAALRYVGSEMDGAGWGRDPARDAPNTQETAWGIQALLSLDQPVAPATWDALLQAQTDDGGFLHGTVSNVWATADAALALAGGLPGPAFQMANVVEHDGHLRLQGDFTTITWTLADGRTHQGTEIAWRPGDGPVHVWARSEGVHFRAVHDGEAVALEVPASGLLMAMLALAVAAKRATSPRHPYSL